MEQQMKKLRELGQGTSSQVMYEDFQPSADWTHDSNCHVLLIDLPDFKKEELKVQVDNSGKVTVSGERKLNETKHSRFKQVFDVPKDSDIEKVSGRLDGGLLFVIIPIKVAAKVEEPRVETAKDAVKHEIPNNVEDLTKKHGYGHDIVQGVKKEIERIEGIAAGLNGEKGGVKKEVKETIEGIAAGLNGEKGAVKKEVKERIEGIAAGLNVEKGAVKKEVKERIDGISAGLSGNKREREDWRKKLEKMKAKEGMDGFMDNAKEIISNNKTVIVTAVLAISVGLYITHRLRSGGR